MTDKELDLELASWLAAGPAAFPADKRHAILDAVHLLPRRNSRALDWLPRSQWRRAASIAVVAVLVAVGALGWSLWRQLAVGPAASPSPSPSPSPVATPAPSPTRASSSSALPSSSPNSTLDPLTWAAFTSTINGFSARFPSDWTVTPATKPGDLASISGIGSAPVPVPNLGDPFLDGADDAVFDEAVSPADWPEITGVSTKLPPGMTADQWLAAYRQPIVDGSADECFPTRDKWEAVTVDGQTNGGLYAGCEWHYLPSNTPDQTQRNYFESMLFVQGRVYIFQLNLGIVYPVSPQNQAAAHQETRYQEEARQLFRAFLSTVTFDAASAQDPPASPTD